MSSNYCTNCGENCPRDGRDCPTCGCTSIVNYPDKYCSQCGKQGCYCETVNDHKCIKMSDRVTKIEKKQREHASMNHGYLTEKSNVRLDDLERKIKNGIKEPVKKSFWERDRAVVTVMYFTGLAITLFLVLLSEGSFDGIDEWLLAITFADIWLFAVILIQLFFWFVIMPLIIGYLSVAVIYSVIKPEV